VRLVALAFVALVATGCMGRSLTGGGNTATIPRKTWVFVSLWPHGAGSDRPSVALALWCRGPGGEHGGAYRPITAPKACQRLVRAGAQAFKSVPQNVACTEIYGGPAEARVQGFVAGRRIDALFSRGDGCQIERWNRLRFLFPGVR
jgi:hypothetical protein